MSGPAKRPGDPIERCQQKLLRLSLGPRPHPEDVHDGDDVLAPSATPPAASTPTPTPTALVLYQEPAPVTEQGFCITVIHNHAETLLGRLLAARGDTCPDESQALTLYTPVEELVERAREAEANLMIE